jgi:hypothetical protein
MPRYLCRDGDSNVLPGTHEAFVFKDKNLQELFLQVVGIRREWLASANDCAGVVAVHLWGKRASAGNRFTDTMEGLAAVEVCTGSDQDGCYPKWMIDVDAGTHAAWADRAVVDVGDNMRRRQWMYIYQLVRQAVSRACDLGHMACTTAAVTGTHNMTETVMLKPRVVVVSSYQIQLEAERTLQSAENKTAAATAIVQRLCASGLKTVQSEEHKDGSVSVAVVLDSRHAARTFIANLAALRADEKPAEKAAPAPGKKVAAKKDESSDEDSDESEDEKRHAAKSHATKCVAAADLMRDAEAHGDAGRGSKDVRGKGCKDVRGKGRGGYSGYWARDAQGKRQWIKAALARSAPPDADYEGSDGDDVPLADKAPTSASGRLRAPTGLGFRRVRV